MSAQPIQFYLDLDGVLADYAAGMVNLGYTVDPALGRDLNRSGTHHPLKREMYDKIKGTAFYRHLPLMDGAVAIFNAVARTNPAILTAAPKFGATEDDFHVNPFWLGAAYHKRVWVEHALLPACAAAQMEAHLAAHPGIWIDWSRPARLAIPDDRFICTTSARKQEFMHRVHAPTQVLIDDRVENCNRWVETGGVAILHDDVEFTLSSIQILLNNFERDFFSPGLWLAPHHVSGAVG